MTRFEQVMKLIDAGYTKAEIDALMAPEAEKTAAQDEPSAEQVTPEEPAQPEPETKNSSVQTALPQTDDRSDRILEAINRLTGAMINQNLNSQMFANAPGRTVDDALAEIIAPPAPAKRNIK